MIDLASSHVLPALIRKFHDAKAEGRTEVPIWGTGSPHREFLHVDDLAEMVRDIVHPGATLSFDASKPDGTPKKLLDVSRLHALGWRHRMGLREGILSSYRWFLENHSHARGAGKGAAA